MCRFGLTLFVTIGLAGSFSSSALSQAPEGAGKDSPPIESFLTKGQLEEGIKAMQDSLARTPKDQQTMFSLGVAQTLRAFEHAVQTLYAHGFGNPLRAIPGAGTIMPENPEPKTIAYKDARKLIESFAQDLAQAQSTLAAMSEDDIKLPLHVGLIRLDINNNNQVDTGESLWQLHRRGNPFGPQPTPEELQQIKEFVIVFDRADAHWLEGYCHFLQGFCKFLLAYDHSELFNRTAHFFFPDVDSPYGFLVGGRGVYNFGGADISDLIAMIHLINFPVSEPKRTQASLEHFQAMLSKSRQMWRAAEAETDDDREWIPNPRQTTVLPDVQISPEMVAGWEEFLNEAEAILAGRKLVPFWRGDDPTIGFNLHRFFVEPRQFDLVLWIQGSHAAPYLEKGEITSPDTWRRINDLYDGNFISYAFWLN